MPRPKSAPTAPRSIRAPLTLWEALDNEALACGLPPSVLAVKLLTEALGQAEPAETPAKALEPRPEAVRTLKGGKAPALSPKPAGQPQRRAIEDVLRDQRASAELARRLFGKK